NKVKHKQDARGGVRTGLNCLSTEVVTGNIHLPQQFLSFRRDSLIHCDNALNLILHSWEIGEWRIGPGSQRTHWAQRRSDRQWGAMPFLNRWWCENDCPSVSMRFRVRLVEIRRPPDC